MFKKPFSISNSRKRTALVYACGLLFTLVILVFVLQLWKAELNIPFAYEWKDLRKGGEVLDPIGSNDANHFFCLFKGIGENGWYLDNPAIGMPTGLNSRDFPMSDGLHFLLIKMLGCFTPSYAAAANLYLLLGFFLTTTSALFVFRQLKIGDPLAVCGSLLFSFLPYHFLRGQQHLFLASYYLVPLSILIILWITAGEDLFTFDFSKKKRPFSVTRRGGFGLAVCALVGSAGMYYAMFSVFFFIVGWVFCQRTWKSLLQVSTLIGTIFLSVTVNLLPSIIYIIEHGRNPCAVLRLKADGEFYGLKIIQMFMPVMHHRIKALSDLSSYYYEHAPLITENVTACLGIIGSVGFISLLFWHLGLKWKSDNEKLMSDVSTLNLCSVLLATIGGISSVLTFGISPLIRCYNRISVFIAFFSLIAILLLIREILQRYGRDRGIQVAYLAGALLFLGIADQTTDFFVPPYAQNKASFINDKNFIERIESTVPKGSMIFQLPYAPFPEGPPGSMALSRGYLHSHSLRWSYGSFRGREGDNWIRTTVLSDSNLTRILKVLVGAGFRGIYIDRTLLADHNNVETALKQLLPMPPIESENGKLVFYNFADTRF